MVEHTEAIDQHGDPRYLHLVLAAHDAQRELTGLNIQPAEHPGTTLVDLVEDLDRCNREAEEDMKTWTPEERANHYRHIAEQAEAKAREARERENAEQTEGIKPPENPPTEQDR